MSSKAIYEGSGKRLLYKYIKDDHVVCSLLAEYDQETNWNDLFAQNVWLSHQPLVVKPDQLISGRGKLGLVKEDTDAATVQSWISEHIGKETTVGKTVGKLNHFIIEPFVEHSENDEAYVCIRSHRRADTILFHHRRGEDIDDVNAKALKLDVPLDFMPIENAIKKILLKNVDSAKQDIIASFIFALYKVYLDLQFAFLEINPLVTVKDKIYILDLTAELDATANFAYKSLWGEIHFPPPFGCDTLPETSEADANLEHVYRYAQLVAERDFYEGKAQYWKDQSDEQHSDYCVLKRENVDLKHDLDKARWEAAKQKGSSK